MGHEAAECQAAGGKASAKLMIPIMIMFMGILVMVLIPIFTNLGV